MDKKEQLEALSRFTVEIAEIHSNCVVYNITKSYGGDPPMEVGKPFWSNSGRPRVVVMLSSGPPMRVDPEWKEWRIPLLEFFLEGQDEVLDGLAGYARAEIDRQLREKAQGYGLARLQAIVGETGYFTDGKSFYQSYPAGKITESDIEGYYMVPVSAGYNFSMVDSNCYAETDTYCRCFLDDLEGWSSIPRERLEKARADYERITEMVREAMNP